MWMPLYKGQGNLEKAVNIFEATNSAKNGVLW